MAKHVLVYTFLSSNIFRILLFTDNSGANLVSYDSRNKLENTEANHSTLSH